MIPFFLRRLLWLVLTLWVVFTVSFFLMRAVPGGPFDAERKVSAEILRNMEKKYDLDKPIWQQYWLALTRATKLDLGHCMKVGDYEVTRVIADGFPISAVLGLTALTFALILGLLTGVISAVFRGSAADVVLRLAATIGVALPNFVVAGIAIIVFVFLLRWFPAAGWGTPSQVVLPALCLGAPYAAYIARISRTSMLDVLSQDFIRTARAKGVGPTRVVFVHALRGALLPVVSFLGPAVAGILTGSLVVEKIFAIPGMGEYFIKSAELRDYPLSMGLVLLYTLLLYTMNFIVDISYSLLDPRVELET